MYVCMYVCVCMCVCMRVCVCLPTYTHIHTYIHTHIHTHTFIYNSNNKGAPHLNGGSFTFYDNINYHKFLYPHAG